MPLTSYAIETFVSAKITALTESNIADMAKEYPDADRWLTSFVGNVIFRNHIQESDRPFLIQFIRKVEKSFDEYRLAKEALDQFVQRGNTGWSSYFKVLGHLESSIAQLYQAFDTARKKLNQNLFETDDGSSLDRLNKIYNTSRHQLAQDEQTVWVTNAGISTAYHELSFNEIEEMLRECASITQRVISGEIEPKKQS